MTLRVGGVTLFPMLLTRVGLGRWPSLSCRRAPLVRSLRTFPARSSRPRSRVPRPSASPNSVLLGLLGVNTLVFGAWWYAKDHAQQGDPRWYNFMIRNFTSGEPQLRAGRWWTLLTACFSHQDATHFGINMLTFALTAPALIPMIGAPTLLSLYVGAGMIASATSIVWPYIVDPIIHGERTSLARHRYTFSQGASGSVYAILSAFTMMQPMSTVYLFYAIPLPAWVCIGGIAAWELYQASTPHRDGHVDHVGHVGGLLAGVAFARFRGL